MVFLRKRRSERLINILLQLESLALTTADLLTRVTKPTSIMYGSWVSKEAWRNFHKKQNKQSAEIRKLSDDVREHQILYTLMSRLKKEGLIRQEMHKKKSLWKITKSGLKRLLLLKEKQLPKKTYVTSPTKKHLLIIVTFDIPEKERHKRDWLRVVLKNLTYRMLSESVWIGNNRLPEEFFEDLRKTKTLQYIKVFSVHRRGTINQLN